MKVGVVVPALDEAPAIVATLEALHAQRPDDVVVADGGSSDGTAQLAGRLARVIQAPRGRARQLNAGSRAVAGDALLFLHADSRLPDGAIEAVRTSLADPAAAGGSFHKRFDSDRLLLRHVRWRTRLWHRLGLAFGDQALFASRAAFERIGGFRTDVGAEDMDLAWRLRRAGRFVLLDAEVLTSARRFEDEGVVRTWLRWWRVGTTQHARAVLLGTRRGDLARD